MNMTEPAVNVIENNDHFRIEVAAPGMKKENFKIKVDGNLLEISAEKQEEKEDTIENYTRREFAQSSFSRTFTLPDAINADKIAADYRDGLLKLILPKKDEAKKREPKQIPIS
jgi:HSP20 family protein